MARPRTIKLEEGEVILKNIPPEKADPIADLIRTHAKNATVEVLEEMTEVDLVDKALGLRYNQKEKRFELVTLSYNVNTKQAKVDEVLDATNTKRDAVVKFKMKVGEFGFV